MTQPSTGRPAEVDRERTVAALTAEWDIRGIDLTTLRLGTDGTISPRRSWREGAVDPLAPLPLLTTEPAGGSAAEIALGEVIGEGGMGVVHAARQTSLDRTVAVKLLLPGDDDDYAARQLLLEARITGALEHPNTVPIHALGRDEQGHPLVVMKRIAGVSWQSLLDRERSPEGAAGADLARHLRILQQVARAADYAHAHGIVHRDLKPDNVMIGDHGEVYVVDWGIAVTTRDDGVPGVPRAREIDKVTGTPAYMAPEMACANGPAIEARTDVYMLGAILHDLLTGQPPHLGPNAVAMLARAYASTPPRYDPTVPDELGAIATKAMSRERDERFPSAAAFATALERFLAHRDSTLLSDEAAARLDELRDRVARSDREGDRDAVYNDFNRCRFGFVHALRIWQENVRAREQLQEALELMIDHELRHGSAGAAAALLAELSEPEPQLLVRLERKREEEHRAERELERLRREADPTLSDRPRALGAFAVALTWGPGHLLAAYLEARDLVRFDHLLLGAAYAGCMVISIGMGHLLRHRLQANASGLRTQLAVVLTYCAMAAVWPLGDTLGAGVPATLALGSFVGLAMWTLGAMAVDRRLVAYGLSMLGSLVGTLLWPAAALVWMGLGGMAGGVAMGWLRLRTTSSDQARPLSQRWSQRRARELLARPSSR